MPIKRKNSKRRRSNAVPLSLVPALAAAVTAGCSTQAMRPVDPCEPDAFVQATCETAVANRGYWYGGTWYPHVYPYLPLYYMSRHNSYIAGGGRMRSISPTVYVPRTGGTARPGVVRGGFGGIGSGRIFAGS